jgi:hypothetical protein
LGEIEKLCRSAYERATLLEAEDRFDRNVAAGPERQERCMRSDPDAAPT